MTAQKDLREHVTEALSALTLPARIKREVFADLLHHFLCLYLAGEEEAGAHAKKLRGAAEVAKKLRKAIESAADDLAALGAREEIAEIKQEYQTDGVDEGEISERTIAARGARWFYPVADLTLSLVTLERAIRRWESVHRPLGRVGRQQAANANFARGLHEICTTTAGLSEKQTEDVLSALSGIEGMPKFTMATIKKRGQRARKLARTK
ncbi:MAG: hypothetical protein ACYDAE_00350 [Steroidobacteraceae bacterium]